MEEIIMFSDDPTKDAISHINRLDHLPIEEVPTEECGCCNNRVEDFRISPDRGGFCCVECIGNGKAEEYYYEYHTPEVLEKWIESLKLK